MNIQKDQNDGNQLSPEDELFSQQADAKEELAYAIYGSGGIGAIQSEEFFGVRQETIVGYNGRIKHPTMGHRLMAQLLVSEPGSPEFYPEPKPAGTTWVVIPHDRKKKDAHTQSHGLNRLTDENVFYEGTVITSLPVQTDWGYGYLAADQDGLMLIKAAKGITREQLGLFVAGALQTEGLNWKETFVTSPRNDIMPRHWHKTQVSVIAIPNTAENHLEEVIDASIKNIEEQLKLFGMKDTTNLG